MLVGQWLLCRQWGHTSSVWTVSAGSSLRRLRAALSCHCSLGHTLPILCSGALCLSQELQECSASHFLPEQALFFLGGGDTNTWITFLDCLIRAKLTVNQLIPLPKGHPETIVRSWLDLCNASFWCLDDKPAFVCWSIRWNLCLNKCIFPT